MDGNRRWATSKALSIKLGHKNGSKTAENIANQCKKLGVKYLTLYVFSKENWKRPKSEVAAVLTILQRYLDKDINTLIESGIRISFIGDREDFSKKLRDSIDQVEALSMNGSFHLILSLSYGSRDEIRKAAADFASYCIENDALVDNKVFDKFISTNKLNIPDPDLLIRTGNEFRISNFLLWQIAYSELYFTPKLWPEFSEEDMIDAIAEFNRRERRYGK
jgi:undecaprenyl diphosphate synthase